MWRRACGEKANKNGGPACRPAGPGARALHHPHGPFPLPSPQLAILALLAALATASAGYLPAEGSAPPDFVSFAAVGRGARAQNAEASSARTESAVRPPARSVFPQTVSPSALDTLAGTFVSRLQTMRPKGEGPQTAEVGGFLPGAEP